MNRSKQQQSGRDAGGRGRHTPMQPRARPSPDMRTLVKTGIPIVGVLVASALLMSLMMSQGGVPRVAEEPALNRSIHGQTDHRFVADGDVQGLRGRILLPQQHRLHRRLGPADRSAEGHLRPQLPEVRATK